MPAPNAILRLLALGVCADVATAFATIRSGKGETISISTESASSESDETPVLPCACSALWYCQIEAPYPSIQFPLTGADFTDNLFASYTSYCWNMCYKNPGYMKDGSKARMWDNCHIPVVDGVASNTDPAEVWRTSLCTKEASGAGKYTKALFGRKVKSNPFKDSCPMACGDNGDEGCWTRNGNCNAPGNNSLTDNKYVTYLCFELGGQTVAEALLDPRDADGRCEFILAPDSLQVPSGDSCHKSMKDYRATKFTDLPAGERQDTAICEAQYKYFEEDGNRFMNTCYYDEAEAKCKMWVNDDFDASCAFNPPPCVQPTTTKVGECKALLCGVNEPVYDADGLNPVMELKGGTRPDDDACTMAVGR